MMAGMREWYAALLWLFPAAFRVEFGAEILDAIQRQRRDLADPSWSRLLRFHLTATLDLARAVGTQRRPMLLRTASAALLIAALGNVAYDFANPHLSMGFFAWALTFIALASSRLMSAAAEKRRRTS